jgi:hypothetical protein
MLSRLQLPEADMTHEKLVEFMNRPIVRIPSSIAIFAGMMVLIIWISNGAVE